MVRCGKMVPRRGSPSLRTSFLFRDIDTQLLWRKRSALRRVGFLRSAPVWGRLWDTCMPTKATISGLKLRGNVYYLRVRVPAAFADIEPKAEVSRSLHTGDRLEAEARCANAKLALHAEWQAMRAGRTADIRFIFDASTELLKGWNMTFSPMEDLISGPIENLIMRIEAIANLDPSSASVPAVLGAVDLPDCSLHEMAKRMPLLKAADIRAKNLRQRREWCGNFKRAAKDFEAQIGTRTVFTISEQDAADYEDFWRKRVRNQGVSANYANKQIRYVRQMITAHLDDIRMPRSKRHNPFVGVKIKKNAYDKSDEERRRLPLPERWIKERLIRDRILEGLNQQASDVAIIAAIGGCRSSEVYDVPPEDIFLDHVIPHFKIRVVTEGPNTREIKNQPSTRIVVLLGPALEAMRRNPEGFTRYRGKASYSGDVNNFLRNNDLFPPLPSGAEDGARYVISGTRHSFEDRMKAAKIGNEERAFLMGHSVAKVRGRPVYGSLLDLPIRALLQEMVTFECDNWAPRPIAELWTEIDRLLEEQGHRVE